MDKLPTSESEIKSLFIVAVMAALAALARILYGKDDLSWRYTAGSIMVAMVTAMLVYGSAVTYIGLPVGGYVSTAIGAGVGLFTDDVLRRVRAEVRKRGLPGTGIRQDD